MDNAINALKPGGRVVISRANGLTVSAERSGDGKTVRIVRESAAGFSIIRQERF